MKKLNGFHCIGYAVAGIVVCLICAFQNELFGGGGTKEIFRMLSDCFVAPGILLSGIAAISWAGALGTFDMLGYGMKVLFFFIPSVKEKTEKSFYDYRANKDEKGRKWLPEMLIVGLAFFLCGVICFIVYCLL